MQEGRLSKSSSVRVCYNLGDKVLNLAKQFHLISERFSVYKTISHAFHNMKRYQFVMFD